MLAIPPAAANFPFGSLHDMDAQCVWEASTVASDTAAALAHPHLPSPSFNTARAPIASAHLYSTPSARWKALVARDSDATDAFVYAVRTTRIYCRPDCRARLARRANVGFYDSAALAERDGFRACKRCRPNVGSQAPSSLLRPGHSPDSVVGEVDNAASNPSPLSTAPAEEADDVRTKIQRAVRLIRLSASESRQLSLAQLSKEVGLSKWHLQRVFKRLQGVTPREMAELMIQGKGDDDGDGDVGEGRGGNLSGAQSRVSIDAESATPVTSSDAGVLTPMVWGDGGYDQQPVPFLLEPDMNPDVDVDVEDLLSDLFPELFAGKGISDRSMWALNDGPELQSVNMEFIE